MLLEGLQLPLTTPFYPDGRLNLLKLEHNVSRYSKTPVAGMVVLGGSGEPSMLSFTEAVEVLRAAVAAAAPEKVMIAGVSRDSVSETLELVEAGAAAGYDVALVSRPATLSDEARGLRTKEMLTYFQMVADRSSLPVLLVGEGLSEDVVEALAGHPQVLGVVESDATRVARLKERTAGVKREVTVTQIFQAVTRRMRVAESSGVIGIAELSANAGAATLAAAPAIKTRSKQVGFQVLMGSTNSVLDGLLAGAVGAMPPLAAATPQGCYEIVAAWKDGDQGLAMEKQVRVAEAANLIEWELGVAGVKYGCDLNGYYGGPPRLPVLPVDAEERAAVEGLMLGLRN